VLWELSACAQGKHKLIYHVCIPVLFSLSMFMSIGAGPYVRHWLVHPPSVLSPSLITRSTSTLSHWAGPRESTHLCEAEWKCVLVRAVLN